MTVRLPPHLLALTTGKLQPGDTAGTRDLVARVRSALTAKLPGLLLREPFLEDGAFLQLAQELRGLTQRNGAWFGLHDRVHLSQAAQADGVHLGFRSLPANEARQALEGNSTSSVAIGLSTHAGDPVERVADCDYIFHGPVHDTPSKRNLPDPVGPIHPIGLQGLKSAVELYSKPLWALGGFTSDADLHPELSVAGARRQGAQGCALLAGILSQPSPAKAVERLLNTWPSPQ